VSAEAGAADAPVYVSVRHRRARSGHRAGAPGRPSQAADHRGKRQLILRGIRRAALVGGDIGPGRPGLRPAELNSGWPPRTSRYELLGLFALGAYGSDGHRRRACLGPDLSGRRAPTGGRRGRGGGRPRGGGGGGGGGGARGAGGGGGGGGGGGRGRPAAELSSLPRAVRSGLRVRGAASRKRAAGHRRHRTAPTFGSGRELAAPPTGGHRGGFSASLGGAVPFNHNSGLPWSSACRGSRAVYATGTPVGPGVSWCSSGAAPRRVVNLPFRGSPWSSATAFELRPSADAACRRMDGAEPGPPPVKLAGRNPGRRPNGPPRSL